jgi:hypothetical protein
LHSSVEGPLPPAARHAILELIARLRARPEAEQPDVSPGKFDKLIANHRMPRARCIDGRKVWDVRELDLSFDALPRDDGGGNSWGDV